MGASHRPARLPFRGGPRMNNPWLAALSALFLWWFSTGIIIWRVKRADHQGRDAHLWSVILGLPLVVGGAVVFVNVLDDDTATGAYLGFLSALAIWAWIELAFLSGIIAGPNTTPCPPHASTFNRFLRACGTIAWHELLLMGTMGAMAVVTEGHANIFGLWTFVILFFARISAKLNLFFGVPRIHTEFLPQTLSHLPSHFRRAPMNAAFPIWISALTFAVACFIERAWNAPTPGHLVGFTLLSALSLLALLEHWFMVLPLPDQKLWRWMIPAPPVNKPITDPALTRKH